MKLFFSCPMRKSFWAALLLSFVLFLFDGTASSALAAEKPVNFIFLIDVSGSMLSKSTMVNDSAGNKVTLFEALRKAVRDIIADERLIKRGSRVAFITFGTTVDEKTDWPSSIESETERNRLVSLIASPQTLSADRKGDTYMGGALNQALARANDFALSSDPCTNTFILMLTDGWDEPPKDAQYQVQNLARRIVDRKHEIHKKLGIDTWQIAVIGLKRLPTAKAGTTTAAQLATMLEGTFLDITQEKGGSVSEQIYSAVSKTLANQRGVFTLLNKPGCSFPIVDFGTVDNTGWANGSLDLELLACDEEEISALVESSLKASGPFWKTALSNAKAIKPNAKIEPVNVLPASAITISSAEPSYTIKPNIDKEGHRSAMRHTINLRLHAGSECPVGTFVGRLQLQTLARCPDSVPYIFTNQARLAVAEDPVKIKVKRLGKYFNEETPARLAIGFVQSKGSPSGAVYHITASVPHEAKAIHAKQTDVLDAMCFENGKPVSISFDTGKQKSSEAIIKVLIPANAKATTYEGRVKLEVSGPSDMVAPDGVAFEITLLPTDWERIAPLAIPMIFLLMVGAIAYIYFWFVSQGRR